MEGTAVFGTALFAFICRSALDWRADWYADDFEAYGPKQREYPEATIGSRWYGDGDDKAIEHVHADSNQSGRNERNSDTETVDFGNAKLYTMANAGAYESDWCSDTGAYARGDA